MKIAHVTDLHLNPLHRTPDSRTEGFHDQIGRKLDSVFSLCRDHEVQIGVISGDIFNLKDSRVYNPEDLNYHSMKFSGSPVSWLAIPGNHDLISSSYANVHKTAYYNFVQNGGKVEDVSFSCRVVVDPETGLRVGVIGMPYHPLSVMGEYLSFLEEGKHVELVYINIPALQKELNFFLARNITFKPLNLRYIYDTLQRGLHLIKR